MHLGTAVKRTLERPKAPFPRWSMGTFRSHPTQFLWHLKTFVQILQIFVKSYRFSSNPTDFGEILQILIRILQILVGILQIFGVIRQLWAKSYKFQVKSYKIRSNPTTRPPQARRAGVGRPGVEGKPDFIRG